MMGGSLAHEYMYLTPVGEDTLVLCDACGYAANRQIARFAKPAAEAEAPRDVEKVATPETPTIAGLAALLGVPTSRTAKAVFLVAGHEEPGGTREALAFAVVRGDMEVNETKLANALGASWLRPATDAEIRAAGAEPGYASPIGLDRADGLTVVVDDAVPASPNLVAGANETGYHLMNTNVPRDYEPDVVADIAAADEGHACLRCGGPLRTARGVEVGNIFKLGTRYADAVGATFLDEAGTERPIVMGSYGIGVGRLLASVAEAHHDERGLVWPITVAPYEVHLISLAGTDDEVATVAERVYGALRTAGIDVLYDDRDDRPGVKFADADLIGIPIRLTVGARSLDRGGIELKRRDREESDIVAEDALIERVIEVMDALAAEIAAGVVEVPFG
jgi:prolyl-tRNA synthetase